MKIKLTTKKVGTQIFLIDYREGDANTEFYNTENQVDSWYFRKV